MDTDHLAHERENSHLTPIQNVPHTPQVPPKRVPCEICHKTYASKRYLLRHEVTHDKNRRRYACATCPKTCTTRRILIIHERIHTGEKPYPCEKCPKSFRSSTYLNSHRSSHSETKFICCYANCGKKCFRQETLTDPQKIHHRAVEEATAFTPTTLASQSREYAQGGRQMLTPSSYQQSLSEPPNTGPLNEPLCAMPGNPTGYHTSRDSPILDWPIPPEFAPFLKTSPRFSKSISSFYHGLQSHGESEETKIFPSLFTNSSVSLQTTAPVTRSTQSCKINLEPGNTSYPSNYGCEQSFADTASPTAVVSLPLDLSSTSVGMTNERTSGLKSREITSAEPLKVAVLEHSAGALNLGFKDSENSVTASASLQEIASTELPEEAIMLKRKRGISDIETVDEDAEILDMTIQGNRESPCRATKRRRNKVRKITVVKNLDRSENSWMAKALEGIEILMKTNEEVLKSVGEIDEDIPDFMDVDIRENAIKLLQSQEAILRRFNEYIISCGVKERKTIKKWT